MHASFRCQSQPMHASVHAPISRRQNQNAMFIPTSTLRGFWTPVGCRKKGEVMMPLKPVRFARFVTLLTLTNTLMRYRCPLGPPGGPAVCADADASGML